MGRRENRYSCLPAVSVTDACVTNLVVGEGVGFKKGGRWGAS